MDMKKLEALQNSETFEQELAQVNTAEEMQQLFSRHGVEMSLEEVRELVAEAAKLNDNELSAEDLDDFAGGVWYVVVGKFVLKTVASWLIGKGLKKLTGW